MRVDVWQEPDGQWRWRYIEQGADGRPGYELPSAEHYPSSEAATEAAATAYPGVEVRLERAGGDGRDARQDGRGTGGRPSTLARRLRTVALTVVAAAAVSGWRRRRRQRAALARSRRETRKNR